MQPPVAYMSFDLKRVSVNDLVYQMEVVPDGTIKVWEFQVLELLPSGKIRIHHLGADKDVKMMALYPKHVCTSPEYMLAQYEKELREQLAKLPLQIENARNASLALPGNILRTDPIREFTDIIEEL